MKKLPTFDTAPVYETVYPSAIGFQVIVKPRKPKETSQSGAIVLAKRTRQAEQVVSTIGQLLDIGAKAWSKGEGIDLSGDPNQPTIGDWVVYRQNGGQRLRVRRSPTDDGMDDGVLDEYVLIMTDTDVLARFNSEAEAERFFGWA